MSKQPKNEWTNEWEIESLSEQALLRLEQRNIAFWSLLHKFIPQTNFQIPKGRPTKILDVACGECEEARVITSYFSSGTYCLADGRAELYAVDIERGCLERAWFLLRKYQPTEFNQKFVLVPHIQFINWDATDLRNCPFLEQTTADVSLVRHQFFRVDQEKKINVWSDIVRETIAKTAPEGIAIFTSFDEVEKDLLLANLKEQEAQLLLNERNPFAIAEGTPSIYFDKWITIVRPVTP